MSIKSGRYIITNVRQRNLVTLRDPNDGTPLSADDKKDIPEEQVSSRCFKLSMFYIDPRIVDCRASQQRKILDSKRQA